MKISSFISDRSLILCRDTLPGKARNVLICLRVRCWQFLVLESDSASIYGEFVWRNDFMDTDDLIFSYWTLSFFSMLMFPVNDETLTNFE